MKINKQETTKIAVANTGSKTVLEQLLGQATLKRTHDDSTDVDVIFGLGKSRAGKEYVAGFAGRKQFIYALWQLGRSKAVLGITSEQSSEGAVALVGRLWPTSLRDMADEVVASVTMGMIRIDHCKLFGVSFVVVENKAHAKDHVLRRYVIMEPVDATMKMFQ